MQPWRVDDVMTTDVITAREDTPVAEVAVLLARHRVSGIPVVDRERRVLGVVSEGDFLAKVAAGPGGGRRRRRWRGTVKAAATSARDLMSRPVHTVAAEEPLSGAADAMRARKVRRLLVTDGDERLVGIVTRADLLRPYTRPDADIHREVVDVLRRVLWIGPTQVRASVGAGVVTLTGAVGRRTTAAIAERISAGVPGVVAVENEIQHRFDDAALARSRVHRTNPLSAGV
jgi:CBS-domain-containing membrane protein